MSSCIVPGCNSGYRSNHEKVHLFALPSELHLKTSWQIALRRRNVLHLRNPKVCHKHFLNKDLNWEREHFDIDGNTVIGVSLYERPKLREGAVPSIFPWTTNLPNPLDIASAEQPELPLGSIIYKPPLPNQAAEIKVTDWRNEKEKVVTYNGPAVKTNSKISSKSPSQSGSSNCIKEESRSPPSTELFQSKMWSAFACKGEIFLIQFTKKRKEFLIFLNDLKNLWLQKIPECDFLKEHQLQNPMLDMKQSEAIDQICDLVTRINEDTTAVEIDKENNTIHLKLTTSRAQFQFNFSKTSADVFLQEITVPFIKTIKYLEDQRMMLSHLLQRKDRELEEYRDEKGEISRTDLITEKFDESFLSLDDKLAINVFSNSVDFWNTFVEQHHIVGTMIEVKKENCTHAKRKSTSYLVDNTKKKGSRDIDYMENDI